MKQIVIVNAKVIQMNIVVAIQISTYTKLKVIILICSEEILKYIRFYKRIVKKDRTKSVEMTAIPLGCLITSQSSDLKRVFEMKELFNSSFNNSALCVQTCFNKNFVYSITLEK